MSIQGFNKFSFFSILFLFFLYILCLHSQVEFIKDRWRCWKLSSWQRSTYSCATKKKLCCENVFYL